MTAVSAASSNDITTTVSPCLASTSHAHIVSVNVVACRVPLLSRQNRTSITRFVSAVNANTNLLGRVNVRLENDGVLLTIPASYRNVPATHLQRTEPSLVAAGSEVRLFGVFATPNDRWRCSFIVPRPRCPGPGPNSLRGETDGGNVQISVGASPLTPLLQPMVIQSLARWESRRSLRCTMPDLGSCSIALVRLEASEYWGNGRETGAWLPPSDDGKCGKEEFRNSVTHASNAVCGQETWRTGGGGGIEDSTGIGIDGDNAPVVGRPLTVSYTSMIPRTARVEPQFGPTGGGTSLTVFGCGQVAVLDLRLSPLAVRTR